MSSPSPQHRSFASGPSPFPIPHFPPLPPRLSTSFQLRNFLLHPSSFNVVSLSPSTPQLLTPHGRRASLPSPVIPLPLSTHFSCRYIDLNDTSYVFESEFFPFLGLDLFPPRARPFQVSNHLLAFVFHRHPLRHLSPFFPSRLPFLSTASLTRTSHFDYSPAQALQAYLSVHSLCRSLPCVSPIPPPSSLSSSPDDLPHSCSGELPDSRSTSLYSPISPVVPMSLTSRFWPNIGLSTYHLRPASSNPSVFTHFSDLLSLLVTTVTPTDSTFSSLSSTNQLSSPRLIAH
ncbi:hypothetical protein B0H12DRAFT_1227340 [Mycena haematopus]|nr:hypothetical protein B0H12DRAFT_1227340 [Mycena haematopus]